MQLHWDQQVLIQTESILLQTTAEEAWQYFVVAFTSS